MCYYTWDQYTTSRYEFLSNAIHAIQKFIINLSDIPLVVQHGLSGCEKSIALSHACGVIGFQTFKWENLRHLLDSNRHSIGIQFVAIITRSNFSQITIQATP